MLKGAELTSTASFFMILTSALEADSFDIKGIKIVNTFVQYAYQGTVIASFIFSMGNKPKACVAAFMAFGVKPNIPGSQVQVEVYHRDLYLLCHDRVYGSCPGLLPWRIGDSPDHTGPQLAAAAFCVVQVVKTMGKSIIFAEIIISLCATCAYYFSVVQAHALMPRAQTGATSSHRLLVSALF